MTQRDAPVNEVCPRDVACDVTVTARDERVSLFGTACVCSQGVTEAWHTLGHGEQCVDLNAV